MPPKTSRCVTRRNRGSHKSRLAFPDSEQRQSAIPPPGPSTDPHSRQSRSGRCISPGNPHGPRGKGQKNARVHFKKASGVFPAGRIGMPLPGMPQRQLRSIASSGSARVLRSFTNPMLQLRERFGGITRPFPQPACPRPFWGVTSLVQIHFFEILASGAPKRRPIPLGLGMEQPRGNFLL